MSDETETTQDVPEEEAAQAPSSDEATENDRGNPADGPVSSTADDEPDWKDLAHRKAAEVENLRRQSAQRIQKAGRDGMKRVASELLPALDDFERALAHAEAEEGDEQHTLTKGIRLVQEQLLAALKRTGIETFSPKGEPFDPHLHEAVATVPVDPDGPQAGAESGTVVEVYQAGYRLGDDVLRAAKVVVAA